MKVSRYIIAIDEYGSAHLRRTLSVNHDLDKGEVRYDTKPVSLARAPRYIQDIYDAAAAVLKIEVQRRKDLRKRK